MEIFIFNINIKNSCLIKLLLNVVKKINCLHLFYYMSYVVARTHVPYFLLLWHDIIYCAESAVKHQASKCWVKLNESK